MWRVWKKLRAIGVLGINQRNASYTLRYNERHRYPLVDDKLATKEMALKAGITVPELLHVMRIPHDVKTLALRLAREKDFVIKPVHGGGGKGILVFCGKTGKFWRLLNGELLDDVQLEHFVHNIMSGMYSLAGQRDIAMIERRVIIHPIFEAVSYLGVPDVRIVVFCGVPVMAMLRLPTRYSRAKANLHQGALGVGIDLRSGKTLGGVWRNELINEHPDTGAMLCGLEIPFWPQLLELAARCYELTGLGYLGVDLVIDCKRGPLLLELNARPGLAIQLANRAGLQARLELVKQEWQQLSDIKQRISFAQSSWG